MGRPRGRAHRPGVPEPRRHGRPPRQDPRHRRARPLQRDLRVPRGAGRHRGGPDGRRARQPSRGAPRPGLRLRSHGGAREPDPDGGAARLRALDAGAHRRGRRPRHPVHAPRPLLARPVRPGRPPAADPRHDDQPHERHRRGHRIGQEADQPAPRFGGSPRAALGDGGDRGRGRRRGPPPGLSVRHQAARRQPRPGRRAGPAGRGRRARGLARDACARAAAAT